MDVGHVANRSSSASRQPLYDVFLSFRGPDTRKDFTDCLYIMLTDARLRVFRDEERLERGEEIHSALIEAIKQSKISIPVISKGFASSKSCLMELEQMLECRDNNNHVIVPIFYYVNLSDIRHCKGPFGKALRRHKKRHIDGKFIDSWKSALHRVAQLKGYHLNETSEMAHGMLIKEIIHEVEKKLKKEELLVTKQLVGVDYHVKGIMTKLNVVDYDNREAAKIGDKSVKVLGIYGIPGVGKTVLAKHVYNQLYHLFDACSFIGEIQAKIAHYDVLSVQNKLISDLHKGDAPKFDCSDKALIHIQNRFRNMNVLLLLDDVNDHAKLRELVGELDWLGSKSRVILTSPNQEVINSIRGGAESFLLDPMAKGEALKLFCWHAFRTDSPPEKFKKLSTKMVDAIGRLPLGLKVVGSSLSSMESRKVWRETLTALREAPNESVREAFKKSYNNLDENGRKIFLDIACFFIGEDKRIPYYMWKDCKYSPSKSIVALHARSFVKIGEDKELWMHETLKNFGREIVKNESRDKPWKRSRLYNHNEALHVLEEKKGTDKVEALGLEFGDGSKGNISFKCDQFDGFRKLRFLKLDQADIQGNFGNRLLSLRWLDWQGCPKSFDVQSLNLNLTNLVILDLSWSQVDKDWGGWKLLGEARKLKVLKLTGCVQLTETPEFPASMKLERLTLEDCSKLAVIHPSFGNLTKLVSLNMKGCSLLYRLPDLGHMTGLKELVIDGSSISGFNFKEGSMGKLKILSARHCKHLTEISNSIRYLKSLTYLALDSTEIDTLGDSIGSLEKLKNLSLKNCRRLCNLPDEIGKLRSLQFLDLSDTMIQNLPPSVEDLKAMKVLRMRGTFLQKFPDAILNLEKLEEIDFSLCRSLKGSIPEGISTLTSLAILNLYYTQISCLPASISCLRRLQNHNVSGCNNPPSLIS